ncbi:hypothetical protein M758_4G197400 [Ceratodon purpureus]|nr:hypothetical protein M758_4G197400 [Ceratodon purpureus]
MSSEVEVEVDHDRSQGEGGGTMAEKLASGALIGLTLLPLVVKVNPNFNVVATACLTVFIGCHRSVKPAPPSETMSKEHAMRFPFIGSAVLLSLFLLFKFLPKDLINTVLTLYFFVLGVLALSYVTFYPKLRFSQHWNVFFLLNGVSTSSRGDYLTGKMLRWSSQSRN